MTRRGCTRCVCVWSARKLESGFGSVRVHGYFMASLHKLDDLLAGLGISHMPNAYMPEVLRRCPTAFWERGLFIHLAVDVWRTTLQVSLGQVGLPKGQVALISGSKLILHPTCGARRESVCLWRCPVWVAVTFPIIMNFQCLHNKCHIILFILNIKTQSRLSRLSSPRRPRRVL